MSVLCTEVRAGPGRGHFQLAILGTEFLLYLSLRSCVTPSLIFSSCLVFNKTQTLHTGHPFCEHPILPLRVPRAPINWMGMLPSNAPSFWGKNAVSGQCDLCFATVTISKGRNEGYK